MTSPILLTEQRENEIEVQPEEEDGGKGCVRRKRRRREGL